MDKLFYEKPWVGNFDIHPPAFNSALECVIIEPRCHANLSAVLRNMSCMLPNAALTVFHSTANESFVRDIVGSTNQVKLYCFTESNINRNQYSELLCTPAFWDIIQSPRALIFQTDSGMRKNTMLRFMEFDYVGAPWSWQIYGDTNIYLGNGGFSLRTPSVMKSICSNFLRNPHFPDKEAGEPEDIFYGRILAHINDVCLPSYEEASMFSVEHNTHTDPLGFHQGYAFHPQPVVEKWMTDTDPCDGGSILKIRDAWIESDGGRQWSSPQLVQWLSIGVGSAGFRMPKDTRVACVPRDIHPGIRKCLHITFDGQRNVKIPLYQNRCKEPIHVAP